MKREKTVGRVVLRVLRFVVYLVLRTFGGVLRAVLGFLAVCGMLVFGGFGLIYMAVDYPGAVGPLWGGLWVALGSMALLSAYEALLRLVAPEGTVIVSGA
jgi:hypothetical protein